jgi:hypothetical protein
VESIPRKKHERLKAGMLWDTPMILLRLSGPIVTLIGSKGAWEGIYRLPFQNLLFISVGLLE